MLVAWAVSLIVGLGIALLPTPGGLDRTGQLILAIFGWALVQWITSAMPAGVVGLAMLTLFVLVGVRFDAVMGALTGPLFWLVAMVLLYGQMMASTGLGKRLSFMILRRMPLSYTSIVIGYAIIGYLLAMGIPSITVRIAITMPLAWGLVQALGLKPRSRGAALITLSALLMAMTAGWGFLNGSLWGPFFVGLLPPETAAQVTYLRWSTVMLVPSLLLTVLMVVGLLVAIRPEEPLPRERTVLLDALGHLGPWTRGEIIGLVVIVGSVAGWITQPWHGATTTTVAILGAVLLFAVRILDGSDLQANDWNIVIFMGSGFAMVAVLRPYGIDVFLSEAVSPLLAPIVGDALVFVVVASVVAYLLKFVDPIGLPTIMILYVPLAGTVLSAGIDPLVFATVLISATNIVFFFPYQSGFFIMGEAITGGNGWRSGDRLKMAAIGVGANTAMLAASVSFWRLIGIV